jgi:diketogulonate reductase-like aldo/keto reductase
LQATPEQVFYSFCIGEGIVPLNGTTNEDRMKLGVQVMNGRIGQLSTAEASAIRKMLQ